MSKILIRPMVVALVCGFAFSAPEAQEVRLRPLQVIYVDATGAGISSPQGVAYDGASRLLVADTGNRRLLLYGLSDDSAVPTSEIRLREVTSPDRVRFDSSGAILALDGKSHRLARITSAGEFQGYVEFSSEDDQDPVIRSFEIDTQGNLWVLDVANGRIVMLDPDGNPLRTIEVPPEARFLSDLAVSSSGVVFAIDSVGRTVFVARKGDATLTSLTDGFKEDVEFPTCIVADSSGLLFIADEFGGGIVILGQDGSFRGRQSSMGWKKGFLRYPSDLSVGGGFLFVADRQNNRIQWFEVVQ